MLFPAGLSGQEARKPNLLIIHTDEHNFRTLGCYRAQLPKGQAFIWGEGVKVDTPHVDSLARDGAIFTKFYAASPVCTPLGRRLFPACIRRRPGRTPTTCR